MAHSDFGASEPRLITSAELAQVIMIAAATGILAFALASVAALWLAVF